MLSAEGYLFRQKQRSAGVDPSFAALTQKCYNKMKKDMEWVIDNNRSTFQFWRDIPLDSDEFEHCAVPAAYQLINELKELGYGIRKFEIIWWLHAIRWEIYVPEPSLWDKFLYWLRKKVC